MKIAVISDTHARLLQELPDKLVAKLGEVDLIVHAGDFTEMSLLDELRALGEVKAVCGNMDSGEIRQMLSPKELFEIGGKNIGLTHGAGSRRGITERVRGMFNKPDIIIYGHSHTPENEIVRGVLMFNPGAAIKSFGLITIEKEIRAEIITF
jgi:putative phosphoesterase